MAVKEFLDQMVLLRSMQGWKPPWGYKYGGMEEFVIAHGRLFASRKPTAEQIAYVKSVAGRQRYMMKECYSNAQRLLLQEAFLPVEKRLRYVEGYVGGTLFPIMHGWLVLDGDIVIDPTFKADGSARVSGPGGVASGTLGVYRSPREYFGVTFQTDAVLDTMRRCREYRTLIDDPDFQFPAMRGDLDALIVPP